MRLLSANLLKCEAQMGEVKTVYDSVQVLRNIAIPREEGAVKRGILVQKSFESGFSGCLLMV